MWREANGELLIRDRCLRKFQYGVDRNRGLIYVYGTYKGKPSLPRLEYRQLTDMCNL